jgi:hypothetical protein
MIKYYKDNRITAIGNKIGYTTRVSCISIDCVGTINCVSCPLLRYCDAETTQLMQGGVFYDDSDIQ